jgi:hypothetical protein
MQPKLDAQHILETLAKLRASVPGIDDVPRTRAGREGRSMLPDGVPAETEEDFEYAAVLDGAETLAEDLEAAVARMTERAVASALDIYAMEELARDPANANLLPHLEQMRRAYQRQFGRPIPEKEETCRR